MISETLFVKVKNGRYKIIFLDKYGKAVEIPQNIVANSLMLDYCSKNDAVVVPNIRERQRYLKNVGIDSFIKLF